MTKDYASGFSRGFREGENALKFKIIKLLEEITEVKENK